MPNVGTPSALSPTALTRLAGVDRRRRTAFRDCDGDLFVWCSRPTSNLVLVSGRFAVFLHAAVHYPFSRPALAALAVTVIARCLPRARTRPQPNSRTASLSLVSDLLCRAYGVLVADLLLNVPAAAKPTVVATAATPPTMAIMTPVDNPAAPAIVPGPGEPASSVPPAVMRTAGLSVQAPRTIPETPAQSSATVVPPATFARQWFYAPGAHDTQTPGTYPPEFTEFFLSERVRRIVPEILGALPDSGSRSIARGTVPGKWRAARGRHHHHQVGVGRRR